MIHIAGTAPIPQSDGDELPDDPYRQMLLCGRIAVAAIEDLGGEAGDVVRTRMFISDPEHQDEVGRAHAELFGHAAPAATMVVTALLDPRWKVEIEVEAVIG